VHQAVKVAMTVAVMVAAAAKVVGAVATVVDATAAALTEAVAMVEALRVASMEEREVVVRAARASVAMAPAMVAEEADEPGAAVLVMEAAKGHTPPEVGYPPQKGSCDHRDKAEGVRSIACRIKKPVISVGQGSSANFSLDEYGEVGALPKEKAHCAVRLLYTEREGIRRVAIIIA